MKEAEFFLQEEGFDQAFTHTDVGEYLKDPKQRVAVVVKGPRGSCILTVFQNEEAMMMDFQVRMSLL